MKVKAILLLAGLAATMVLANPAGAQQAEGAEGYAVYDEAAYTEFVESSMKELDALYLRFCEACGADPAHAYKARQEFLVKVRDLMQYMNARFDALDPKTGAALSPTETLVSIHSLTMLVDILAATEIEHLQKHPYIE
jgi:hypothetical protein